MTYDFYFTTTAPAGIKRKNAALTGLAAGTLHVHDLAHTGNELTALVLSDSGNGRHGYEVRIGWDGLHCDCKDWQHYGHKHHVACKHLLAAMLTDHEHTWPQAA